MLKYDSLYQSLKKVSAEWHAGTVLWEYKWNYIKFFPDNTFIYASICGDNFQQINDWFKKGADNVINGSYIFKTNSQLLLKFNENNEVLMGLTNDGEILMQGVQAWELFTPVS